MNICVTGGAGFIGSHLTDRLLALGHTVVVIDNLVTGCREFVHPKAIFYEMDIRDANVAEIFKRHAITHVFHEAAQTMVDVSMKDPVYDCDVNLMGLLNILEACRKESVKKILMPSSAAVYGDCDKLPLEESTVGSATSFYGLTKYTTEQYLALYAHYFKIPYICYRYANVYGPRQGNGGEGGVISIFCSRLQQGEPLYVFGNGEQTRDFVYVADVVEANIAGLLHEDCTGVYNVSTGKELSVNQLIATLAEVSHQEIRPIYEAPRSGDIMYSCLSTKRIKESLGWTAKTDFAVGLAETYNYIADRK